VDDLCESSEPVTLTDRRRFAIPRGVRLYGAELHDEALRLSHPISPTGALVVALLDRGFTVTEVAGALSARWHLDRERARRDVDAFVAQLSEAMLLTERPGAPWRTWPRGLRAAMLSVVTHQPPRAQPRRFPLRRGSPVTMVTDIARGVLIGLGWWWLALTLVSTLLVLADDSPLAVLVLVPALFGATVAHEVGHAAAVASRGAGCFLRVRGLAVAVVHTRDAGGVRVHASGALLSAALGITLLAIAAIAGMGWLALATTPFLAQLVTLTVLFGDGRRIATA